MQFDPDVPIVFLALDTYAPNGRTPHLRGTAHARSGLHVYIMYVSMRAEIANNNTRQSDSVEAPCVSLLGIKPRVELLLLPHVTSVLNLAANLSGLTGESARTEALLDGCISGVRGHLEMDHRWYLQQVDIHKPTEGRTRAAFWQLHPALSF